MNFIINLLSKIEYLFSILQGKGFGAAKISLGIETKSAFNFLSKTEKLMIFDVGANIGEYSEKIFKLNNNCNIIVFEPSKKNFNLLKKKFKNFQNNIKIENQGVNSKSGYFKLYYDKLGSPLASLSKRSFLGSTLKVKGYERVKFTTLKKYLTKNKISTIDLLKLDVEGFELQCLLSAGKYIKKIKVIQFEFGGCNIETRTFFKDFWNFFNKKKFDLYRITPFYLIKLEEYSEKYENFLTTNFIAVNKDFNVKK